MEPRERWQQLQTHLAAARTFADTGDAAASLQEVERALQLDPEFLAARSLKEHLLAHHGVAAAARPSDTVTDAESDADACADGLTAIEAKVKARRAERRLAMAADAARRRNFAAAVAALDEARDLGADSGDVLRVERTLVETARRSNRRVVTGTRLVLAATAVAGVLLARHAGEAPAQPLSNPIPRANATANHNNTLSTGGAVEITRARTQEEIIKLKPAEPSPEPESSEPPTRESRPQLRSPVADLNVPASPVAPPAMQPVAPAVASTAGSAATAPSIAPAMSSSAGASGAPAVEPAPVSAAAAPPVARYVTPPSAVSLPPPPVASVPRTADDENGVREALQRYRVAYEQLNARSAAAVWPAVDERALARAFNGLASQQLHFDACDLNVRGNAATATCRGTASYTPKFGSGARQVEPRTWQFSLQKSAGQWAIENARVER